MYPKVFDMKPILDFLEELKLNNNREWFTANKKKYQEAKKIFENFLNTLIPRLASFDNELNMITSKDCIFRINRDTRFSSDKTPYKTNFGAFITPSGRKGERGGYYFHIEPGMSMLAGGVYMPEPNVLKAIRNEIYFRSTDFKKILYNTDFRKHFGDLIVEDKLKNPPKDFPKDFPDIDLLKYKHYAVSHNIPNEKLTDKDLAAYSEKVFRIMYPLNVFLRQAISMAVNSDN